MSDLQRVGPFHSARIRPDNGSTMYLGNDGGFGVVVELANGVYQIDTTVPYGPGDTFFVTSESSDVAPVVERVNATRIVVRLFANDGSLVGSTFAIVWYRLLLG